MIFHPTDVDGAVLIAVERLEDERGFFARTFCADAFAAQGLDPRVAQCNLSFNRRRGTLRGLHFQHAPHAEAKLVRCTAGAVLDVALDLRPDSRTYRRHVAVELDARGATLLYVPAGVAHGFQTLADDSAVFYQMSAPYHPESAGGVRWNDPAFGIAWPLPVTVISERDRTYPDFRSGAPMTIAELRRSLDFDAAGTAMHALISELYPICRSITGDGLRATLRRLGRDIDLACHEVPTGTTVFDWTVPKEWNIADAWVKNTSGERVIDFRRSNLHVLHYSVPVRRRVGRDELMRHLHSLPEHPQWIPYRTSYYEENWGFCIEHERLGQLTEPEYEVCIDARLADGSLTYGECLIGGGEAEVLLSCHACHPSLCNDNLSGLALTTHLASLLSGVELRYSYRFLFIPGTIGAITWLSRNRERVSRIRHGLVVACVGDPGKFHYKRSRRGAEIDRVVEHVLRHSGADYAVREFSPYGYDERQYCSPGFDLPVGSLTRTPHGCFPEYHTSADDPGLVTPQALAESLRRYLEVIDVLESDRRVRTTNPMCEPQLGRRGLYRAIGGTPSPGDAEIAMLWVLNLADGRHTLLDIAERAGLDFFVIRDAAELLCTHGLLEEGT